MPWRSSLTLVPLMPATTVNESSVGVDRDDRELVGGEADDHVDVVTGLDDRADAADLVDLDGDAALCRRALDVDDRALVAAVEGRGGDLRRRSRPAGGRSCRRPATCR